MLALDRLNGTQKAILGLSTTFVAYFSILVVADFADGSFDEPYHLYYVIGFALLTGLYLRSKSFPDSRSGKFEFPIWIIFLLFSLATFTSYVVFNIGSLLAVSPNLGMPFLSAGIAVSLIVDKVRERKEPDS